MKTIYKYPIETTDTQTIKIHSLYQILCVQVQNEQPCIWAWVDTETPKVDVEIRTFGTGHELPENGPGAYIGTYQLHGGLLVFHVFF